MDQGGWKFRSELTFEARGLKPEHSELPQLDPQPMPRPPDRAQAEVEAEAPAPRKPSEGFPPMGAQPGDGAGPPEPTQTLPTRAELEAQPRSRPTTAHAEGEQAPSKSREPRAENRPEDSRMDSGGPGLTPFPRDCAANEPLADPDYAFHVIFLGDSNVGKTSFLHLLHQNSFATGLTATVGVDFRVKNLLVDNKRFALQLWDTAGQERMQNLMTWSSFSWETRRTVRSIGKCPLRLGSNWPRSWGSPLESAALRWVTTSWSPWCTWPGPSRCKKSA